MSESMYRSQLVRLLKEKADLERKRSETRDKAATLVREVTRIADSITKTTSTSMASQKRRQVTEKQKKAAELEKKASDHETQIARKAAQIASAERGLDQAIKQRKRKEESERKKQRDAEARHVKEMERARKREEEAGTRRRRAEATHAREMTRESERRARLYSPRLTIEYVRHLPEKIRVLFVAANPRDQEQLRLDEEVRDVSHRIRLARFRDSVELHSIWAVRPGDLMDALNEHEPHIVHFSGHGSEEDEIVFLDQAGNTKRVTQEAITATIATTAEHVRLVVFNTCHSRSQAEAVTRHIEAAIGMRTSIGDEAARIFASHFYGAIGSGYSVQRAFAKATAALMLEDVGDEETPELFTGEGVDPDELVFVRSDEPPEAALVA
jgi:hypothetical protein